jgi:hypothetical protein
MTRRVLKVRLNVMTSIFINTENKKTIVGIEKEKLWISLHE